MEALTSLINDDVFFEAMENAAAAVNQKKKTITDMIFFLFMLTFIFYYTLIFRNYQY